MQTTRSVRSLLLVGASALAAMLPAQGRPEPSPTERLHEALQALHRSHLEQGDRARIHEALMMLEHHLAQGQRTDPLSLVEHSRERAEGHRAALLQGLLEPQDRPAPRRPAQDPVPSQDPEVSRLIAEVRHHLHEVQRLMAEIRQRLDAAEGGRTGTGTRNRVSQPRRAGRAPAPAQVPAPAAPPASPRTRVRQPAPDYAPVPPTPAPRARRYVNDPEGAREAPPEAVEVFEVPEMPEMPEVQRVPPPGGGTWRATPAPIAPAPPAGPGGGTWRTWNGWPAPDAPATPAVPGSGTFRELPAPVEPPRAVPGAAPGAAPDGSARPVGSRRRV